MSHKPDCRCPGCVSEQIRPSDAKKQDIIAYHRKAVLYAIADIKAYKSLFLPDDQKVIIECLEEVESMMDAHLVEERA